MKLVLFFHRGCSWLLNTVLNIKVDFKGNINKDQKWKVLGNEDYHVRKS